METGFDARVRRKRALIERTRLRLIGRAVSHENQRVGGFRLLKRYEMRGAGHLDVPRIWQFRGNPPAHRRWQDGVFRTRYDQGGRLHMGQGVEDAIPINED
jgi:hypothetical protein